MQLNVLYTCLNDNRILLLNIFRGIEMLLCSKQSLSIATYTRCARYPGNISTLEHDRADVSKLWEVRGPFEMESLRMSP